MEYGEGSRSRLDERGEGEVKEGEKIKATLGSHYSAIQKCSLTLPIFAPENVLP